jgi:hypothetical protein
MIMLMDNGLGFDFESSDRISQVNRVDIIFSEEERRAKLLSEKIMCD